jgi:hypothetical protein
MTKNELTETVGKKNAFEQDYTLAARLNYESGISDFDTFLNGKSLKEINAVIHLTKYPKGLVFKVAQLFSSIPFGLPYSEISQVVIVENTSELIFNTQASGKIIFSFKAKHYEEIRQYFDDVKLKCSIEKQARENHLLDKNIKAKKEALPNAVTALVLGVFSILTIGIGIGTILGIIGLSMSGKSRKMYQENPDHYFDSGIVTAGYVLSIIGTILGVLYIVLWAVIGSSIFSILLKLAQK